MLRLRFLAPCLITGLFASGILMGDDKKEPIIVRASLPKYYSQLGLSTKQRNEIYKVRGKYAAEIQELKQKISDLMDQEKSDCEKLLTSAQKARLQEILANPRGRKGVDEEDTPATVDKKKAAATKDKSKVGPTEIKK